MIFFSSLVSTSALSVTYTSKRPIIIDAPYPLQRAVPVSRPGGLLLRTGTIHLKSTCITGILEAEATYMMESAIRFIDATEDLVFCH